MNIRVGIPQQNGTFANKTVPAKAWAEIRDMFTNAVSFTDFTDRDEHPSQALLIAEALKDKTGFDGKPDQRMSRNGSQMVVVRKRQKTTAQDYLQALIED